MNFETIKKNNKTKIITGVIVLLILTSVVMFVSTKAKYRSVQSLKLASGTVKINSYDFKIMAMYQQKENTDCTEDSCYDVLTGRMPTSGYIINEDKSYCTIDGKSKDTEAVLKTIGGHHVVENLIKNEKCYIWFDKYVPTASETLIASFETYNGYKGETSPDFTSVATGTETNDNNGVYRVSDGMYGGNSYYWRGAATTNHVIFDNKCWRIVRINGDKTIRLIYNGTPSGTTCPGNGSNSSSVVLSGTKYNSSYDNSSYVGWSYTVGSQRPNSTNPQTSGTRAPLRVQLEDTWYANNISVSAKEKIASGKFCNDRNMKSGTTWQATPSSTQYYAAYQRLSSGTKTPTLSCPDGDVYELKIGMITADEVTFAGASGEIENKSYYLCNGQYYWTMTPRHWVNKHTYVYYVDASGYLNNSSVDYTLPSARPIVNLSSDVTFNAGSDGTQNNPYIVEI